MIVCGENHVEKSYLALFDLSSTIINRKVLGCSVFGFFPRLKPISLMILKILYYAMIAFYYGPRAISNNADGNELEMLMLIG